MKEKTGVEVQLTPGGRGEFTVLVDGKKLWDKTIKGRFPAPEEIVLQLG